MLSTHEIEELRAKAAHIRAEIVRLCHECGRNAHPGPALSIADLLTALYCKFMRVDPGNPQKTDRDRLVLSKGHSAPALYAVLADRGFFPKEHLATVRHMDSILQGHPDMKKTPGVDMTSGSLGNGLGLALGMACKLKLDRLSSKVFCVLGDGEMNEGTVWEAVNIAPARKCDNLVAIVDMNGWQSCGSTEDICPMPNMRQRFEDFGWRTIEINGHDMRDIASALDMAVNCSGRPSCIVAHTVKGKGVSFMEHNNAWHQKPLSRDLYEQAMAELEVAG